MCSLIFSLYKRYKLLEQEHQLQLPKLGCNCFQEKTDLHSIFQVQKGGHKYVKKINGYLTLIEWVPYL